MALYSAGVRYCAGEINWHNIDPSIVAGFYIVRVPGIVRVNFRDAYPHYIGPPTVYGSQNWRADGTANMFGPSIGQTNS